MNAHVCALAAVVVLLTPALAAAWQTPPPGVHPRLVFTAHQVPELRARLDTPRGQRLFAQVRSYADNWVLHPDGFVAKTRLELEQQLEEARRQGETLQPRQHGPFTSALGAAENAALVYAVLGEEAYGRAAVEALLTFLPYTTSEALRPAALIYDWCHPLLSGQDKALVHAEMARLAEATRAEILHQPFSLGPCPVNQAIYWGMLTAGYLGIAALVLEGEHPSAAAWEEIAERCLVQSLNRFLDEEGYHENGPAYVDYGFSNTSFYLEALRLRGMDFASHPRLSRLPEWMTYLFLPGAHGVAPQLLPVGNSNFGNATGQDGYAWLHHAMPDHPHMATVYRHVMAPANINAYIRTVGALFLWDRPPGPGVDFATLPPTRWFPDGGVFMRTGWGFQDLAFWLKTQQHRCTTGKHDDYGSFYLHAYGEPFAVEGMGKVASSEAHNLVFINDRALDRASYDVMPSAPLVELVDGAFATAATVDQREAYSEDIFFEGEERRLVSRPLNPVERARRTAVTVWAGQNVGPYFLVVDDLVKDGETHDFRWQMLVNPAHQMKDKGAYVTLHREKLPAEGFYPAEMDAALLSPGPGLTLDVQTEDERTVPRLLAQVEAANPHFTVCLYPRRPGQPTVWGMPDLSPTRHAAEGGHGATLRWPECVDRLVVSYGDTVEIEGLRTDARLALVRTALPPWDQTGYGEVLGFLLIAGTFLEVDGHVLVRSVGPPLSLSALLPAQQVALGMRTSREEVHLGSPAQSFSAYPLPDLP